MLNPESLTAEYAKTILDYNESSGILTWKKRPPINRGNNIFNSLFPREIAGFTSSEGYTILKIMGVRYPAHRVIWLMVYGNWPVNQIDHINRKRGDNRLVNLRSATNSQNQMNASVRSDNPIGIRGISWDKDARKWRAQINKNGRRINLGRFKTINEAQTVYMQAARKTYGEFSIGYHEPVSEDAA